MYKQITFGILVVLILVIVVMLFTTKKSPPLSKPVNPKVEEELKMGSTPLVMDEYEDSQDIGPPLNPFDHPPPEDAMQEMSNFETVNGDDFYTYQRDRINMVDTDRYE